VEQDNIGLDKLNEVTHICWLKAFNVLILESMIAFMIWVGNFMKMTMDLIRIIRRSSLRSSENIENFQRKKQ